MTSLVHKSFAALFILGLSSVLFADSATPTVRVDYYHSGNPYGRHTDVHYDTHYDRHCTIGGCHYDRHTVPHYTSHYGGHYGRY